MCQYIWDEELTDIDVAEASVHLHLVGHLAEHLVKT